MNSQTFYRGSRVLAPVNHIVIVTMANGTEYFRRASMNATQMVQLERRLLEAQHTGDIAAYVITAANDCTFPDLLTWLDSLKYHAEQPALLNMQQNSLFNGL
jgi:hypothetical protein